ncbi:MAG: response regulator [Planctomycetota bacterium]
MTSHTTNPTAILYVDDEAQALKYFRKTFENEYVVHTASSVGQAKDTLQKFGERIAVLLTDQRMPGEVGTELLAYARDEHPQIVRMLTTAYADLNSAIEAVNAGQVLRYIRKPWDIHELQGFIQQGVDLYELRQERDQLLSEKFSIIESSLWIDRLRTLAVLGASFEGQLKNVPAAIDGFLKYSMAAERRDAHMDAAGWEDLWVQTINEGESLLVTAAAVRRIVGSRGDSTGSADDAYVHSLEQLVRLFCVEGSIDLAGKPAPSTYGGDFDWTTVQSEDSEWSMCPSALLLTIFLVAHHLGYRPILSSKAFELVEDGPRQPVSLKDIYMEAFAGVALCEL